MPYLRYSRNKKGYENTYVLHASRTGGRPEVLYLFRTPPNIKVGRGALDSEALSAIESAHPELNFDWGKMRRDRPKPAAPSVRKSQRDKNLKPVASQRRSTVRSGPAAESKTVAGENFGKESSSAGVKSPGTERPAVEGQTQRGEQGEPILRETSPVPVGIDENAEPTEIRDSREQVQQEHPVSALLGVATLGDLRAKYMELLVRFDNANLEDRERLAVLERGNALDPDGWEAGEEVVHAIESFHREWRQILELIDG